MFAQMWLTFAGDKLCSVVLEQQTLSIHQTIIICHVDRSGDMTYTRFLECGSTAILLPK